MKNYVMLTADDDALVYPVLPASAYAWRMFGWEPLIGLSPALPPVVAEHLADRFYLTEKLPAIDGIPHHVVTKVARLYMACLPEMENKYVAMGNAGILPMSDFLPKDGKPRLHGVNLPGLDLNKGLPVYAATALGSDWRRLLSVFSENPYLDMAEALKRLLKAGADMNQAEHLLLLHAVKERGDFFEKTLRDRAYNYGRMHRDRWAESLYDALHSTKPIDCVPPVEGWRYHDMTLVDLVRMAGDTKSKALHEWLYLEKGFGTVKKFDFRLAGWHVLPQCSPEPSQK